MPRVVSRASGVSATRANESDLTFGISDSLQASYYDDASEEHVAASWLQIAPVPIPWMGTGMQQYGWISHDHLGSSIPGALTRAREEQQQPLFYDEFSTVPYPLYEDAAPTVYAIDQQPADLHTSTQVLPSGPNYHFQTPVTPLTGHYSFHSTDPQTYQHYQGQPSLPNNHMHAWHEEHSSCATTPSHPQSSPRQHTRVSQRTYHFQDETKDLYTARTDLKSAVPSEPVKKRSRVITPEPDINEFVVVFETAPVSNCIQVVAIIELCLMIAFV